MSLLQPPDAFERIAVEAIMDRVPDVLFGRTFWRIKKFTWGEGTTWRGNHEPGQRYAVDVVLEMGGHDARHGPGVPERLPGAVVAVLPLPCLDAQQAALSVPPEDHHHDDAVCRYIVGNVNDQVPVFKAWVFLSVEDAVLASLRWDPESETEPFGWHKALDGSHRVRPGGDPLQEITVSDSSRRRG